LPGFLKHFFQSDRRLFVSEFGHSEHTESKTVGPWSREMYILHVVIRGNVAFSGFNAEEGQAFLIAKEHLHSFTIGENYEHYWIGFDGEDVVKLLEGFRIGHDSHQLFFIENFDYAKILLSQAYERFASKDIKGTEALARSVLFSVLPLLKGADSSESCANINYAEKARMFIKANYTSPITMEEIARELHISEKYMYRLFLERFGMSVQGYLIKTRMEVGANLLKNSGMSVTEIALSVGYASLHAFSKAFSKYYGVSPSVYKKSGKDSCVS